MVTESAMNRTSGWGSPASISARRRAMILVVPSRTQSTWTSGFAAMKASIVAWASSLGCEV